MIAVKRLYTVNHHVYLEGLTRKGTIAYVESLVEKHESGTRVLGEVKFTMGRITNLYNSLVGSEVPNMWGGKHYVVCLSPNHPKQPATISRLKEESPKVNMRTKTTEFGMPRKAKVWGVRRTRSTILIDRKGFSSGTLCGNEPSGDYLREELANLAKLSHECREISGLSEIMSKPKMLLGCWHKIKSNDGSVTPALTPETLDGITADWFEETAQSFKNGRFKFKPARRKYIPKPNGKLRPLTIPSPRDKIVQEAMRVILEAIYSKTFSDLSHGWMPEKGCHTALRQIKKDFLGTSWIIEGDIEQCFPSLSHKIILKTLEERIKDQAFMDLVRKYLKTGYGERLDDVKGMGIGVVQGGNLSPFLTNLYMTPFDNWVEGHLYHKYTVGKRRKTNPEYSKMIRAGTAKDKTVRSIDLMDPNYKRVSYVRYADDFLIGIIGSKEDCRMIRDEIRDYLRDELELKLNMEKTLITNALHDSAEFLGYRIHSTHINKMKVARNSKGVVTRRTSRIQIDAPIDKLVKRLYERGYARKNGQPTRNGKLIHFSLVDLVNHYRAVERGILEYYSIANNYGRVAARIHYILKYSCALTICSKMRLKTLRRTFRKYGKNLMVRSDVSDITTSYPTVSYKRVFRKRSFMKASPAVLVDRFCRRIPRGRRDFVRKCVICYSEEKVEIHHIKKLAKKPKDYLESLMVKMNRKQVPLCAQCHRKVHKGLYDGKRFA